MASTIPQITIQYIGNQSQDEFIKSLGINVSRQSVWYWKEGRQEPSEKTLLAVFRSENSTANAKQWARECFYVLTGLMLEPTFDLEIEHRR